MKSTASSITLLALALLLALPSASRAQVAGAPATIDYQGQVLDSAGAVLAPSTPTNYTMRFRIYTQQTGGTIVWAESQIVTVDKGAFSVRLGQGVPIPAGGGGNEGTTSDLRQAFNGTDRFLGLTVVIPPATPAEVSPRLAFLSSPYALVAERAKLADTATTATLATTASSVTQASGASTLGTATIVNLTVSTSAKVNGSNTLEFGAGIAGKEASAGKIGYSAFTPAGYLDIVGAGTSAANRKIHMFAEGGLAIEGPVMATSFAGIGTALTALNASNLASGTVPDARLGATVVRSDVTNTFSANQTISNPSTLSFGSTTRQMLNLWGTSFGLGVQNNTLYSRTVVSNGRFSWFSGGTHSDTENDPGTGGSRLASLSSTGFTLDSGRFLLKAPLDVAPGGSVSIGSPLENQLSLDCYDVATNNNRFSWRIGVEASTSNLVFYQRVGTGGFVFKSVIASNGQYSAASDARLKKDIAPLPSVLERVRRLQPKQYRFKESGADSQLETGFIAQEVEPLFPSLVTTVGKDTKALNYASFGPIAVAAIQELATQKDAENKVLAEKNTALTQRLSAVEKRLANLEAQMTKLAAAAPVVKSASVAGR